MQTVDFNTAQIGNYKELFRQADRENIIDLIYDLFIMALWQDISNQKPNRKQRLINV